MSNEAAAVENLDSLDMILQANDNEKRFGKDLTEFFVGTPVTRFRFPKLRRIASQEHQQRKFRVLRERQVSRDLQLCLSKSGIAVVTEHANASSLGSDAVKEVVQALLRRWELPNSKQVTEIDLKGRYCATASLEILCI